MHPSHVRASMRAPRFHTLLVVAGLALAGLLGVTPSASAAPAARSAPHASSVQRPTAPMTAARRFDSKASRVLRVTRRHRGDWYQYGAAGPNRFDCSGLVMYVFKKALGKSLPHNAEEQYRRSRHIMRKHLRPGDLVFQVSGGYAFHVGIYAGHGYMWDAPHTGARVHKHKMYSAHWRYGRIIRWS